MGLAGIVVAFSVYQFREANERFVVAVGVVVVVAAAAAAMAATAATAAMAMATVAVAAGEARWPRSGDGRRSDASRFLRS